MSGPASAFRGAAGADALGLHGTAVVVGERGVLVRGRSGSGKTGLALALIERARGAGLFARLVGDDRVLVVPRGGRLVARPHPALAGLVERRGIGIVAVDSEPACVIALVVDLVDGAAERMPAREALRCTLAGVALGRIAVASSTPPDRGAASALAALGEGRHPYSPCQSHRDAQDCAEWGRSSRQSSRQRHER